jgi:hypothetical protein
MIEVISRRWYDLPEYRVQVLDEFRRDPDAPTRRGRPSVAEQVVLLMPSSLDCRAVALADRHTDQLMEEAVS